MKFLVQNTTDFNHDLIFAFEKAIEYHEWKGTKEIKVYELPRYNKLVKAQLEFFGIENYCPIGSIEFVQEYYDIFGKELKPINVPDSLFNYTNRDIQNFYHPTHKQLVGNRDLLVKSNDVIKSPVNGLKTYLEIEKLPPGNYQVSNYMDILAEYRCFIYQGELLGIHYYNGDPWELPDTDTIKAMLRNYTDSPIAYTLDIAVAKDRYNEYQKSTCVLEVHDFYSCGMYGFMNYEKLPYMYWRSHLERCKNGN